MREGTPADAEVAALIAEMRRGMRDAPAIYQPGDFWDGLISVNLEMLETEGIANFKRTVSNNYYNWMVTSLRDPQVRRALANWCARPTPVPLMSRLEQPASGLRTLNRQGAYRLSRFDAWRYKLFVSILWEVARREDRDGLTRHLEEPTTGNPLRIRQRGRLISQDLANSIIERSFVAEAGVTADGARVAELGAGYGRLAFVYASAASLTYCIFDIPPALSVSQWYLRQVLGAERVVPHTRWRDWATVESNLRPGSVAFFTPDQIELFPDRWFDLTQTISTLPEMPAEQSAHYLRVLGDKSGRALFLKQWRRWRNPDDAVELREADYLPPEEWRVARRRIDPTQPMFFDQLWLRGA